MRCRALLAFGFVLGERSAGQIAVSMRPLSACPPTHPITADAWQWQDALAPCLAQFRPPHLAPVPVGGPAHSRGGSGDVEDDRVFSYSVHGGALVV